MIKIPLKDMNDSVIECELDGVVYFLRMGWNGVAQSWAFSLESANNDLLISGVRVVTNALLLRNYHHLPVPTGELMAVAADDRIEIGRDDFISGDVELVYLSANEL